MNSKIIGAVIIIVILIGGGYWYMNMKPATLDEKQVAAGGFGTYSYECDEHVTFSMTPASDMSSVTITPTSGTFPPAATLAHKGAGSAGGQVFESNGITFTGKGESVSIASVGSDALNCSPVANQDVAPFNFGD